jgi:hypothetical protein
LGDVTVREWCGIPEAKYRVIADPNDPNDVQIRILESDAGTFCFEAFYTGTNNAADIDLIETDPLGVTGTVRLRLEADPNYPAREYGARRVKAIDLSTADTSEIGGIIISDDIATTGDVVCDNITGDLDIGGNVGKIGLPYTTLSAGMVAGTITVNGTLVSGDSIEVDTLGDLTIYGSGVTPVQGDISITNSYAGTLLIDHKFGGEIDLASALTGTISITGVTTGLVNVDGDVSGAILVDANLNKPGRIVIGGSVSQADATVPAVRITGGVVGSAGGSPEDPMIEVGGELGGVIAIDGDLENAVNGVEIYVGSIDLNGLGAIGSHCVRLHGRRERARQIACAGNERVSNRNQVSTRCDGVRRGL